MTDKISIPREIIRRFIMSDFSSLNAAAIQAQTTLPLIESATRVQKNQGQSEIPSATVTDTVSISTKAAALQAKEQ